MGQRQMADAQAKVQANASAAERQRYLHEVSSMRIQQGQEQVAAAQRLQESTKKAREARATARVSAGEAGVAGLSVDALINDLTRKEAEYNFNTQKQLQMSDVNRTLQLRDAGLGFTNNMLRINKPIEQPNYLGAALSGAQTGLSTYSALKD
jgi:isopentenyl diphosphate isomerase/L-lactate dehydrogenase-like FMN-dependent dehydrogenase